MQTLYYLYIASAPVRENSSHGQEALCALCEKTLRPLWLPFGSAPVRGARNRTIPTILRPGF